MAHIINIFQYIELLTEADELINFLIQLISKFIHKNEGIKKNILIY